jgi:PAS domain S-box-containing protein
MNVSGRLPSTGDGPIEFRAALDSVTVLEPGGAPPMSPGEESSFLRLAMDSAHMGAWKVDLAEQKVYWSFHHHVLFDLDPRSFDNRFETVFTCLHPEDRDRAALEFWAAVRACRPLQHEFRVVWRDGSVHWITSRGMVQPGPDGEPAFVYGVNWDSTDRRRAAEEMERRDAELERIRRIFESASQNIPQLVWVTDAAGYVTYYNDRWFEYTGQTREEAAGSGWLNALHREDRAGTAKMWSAAVREECEYDTEYRLRGRDGTYRWFLARSTPVRDVAGKITGWFGTSTDITDRKQVEEALKQSELEARDREQQFKALADSLPQMVYVLDGEGRPIFCNETLFRYTGVKREEISAEGWSVLRCSLAHPEDAGRVAEAWKRSMQTGEDYHCEVRIRRHDGKYRAHLSRAVPVRDDAGSVVRWVASSTDVHDHKLAEEALRRSDKLAAAGRLASSIAHEINNPLQAVTSLVYLLGQEALLSEQGRTLLRTAEQELARMSHTVTQALRFTRTQREPAVTDVRELAESAIDLFRNRLASACIEVNREYDAVPQVLCSTEEIRQVLAALISNSRDAMLSGGKLFVRVREGREWQNGARAGVRVTIADTGGGIADDVRERIFEPFVTTKEATGTGLGLWVASEILRRHGGRIQLRSRKGVGTAATVWIPRDREQG